MLSIKVPPLGESIVEATISRWRKNEGDQVAAGETLVELETDKVTVEVPAPKAGVLVKRAKNEGDVVKVDEMLGEIDEAAAGAAAPAAEPATAAAPAAAAPAAAAPQATPAQEGTEPRAAPAARRMAAEEAIDLREVPGTGRGGVVSKPDVIEYASRRSTEETPAAASEQKAAAPTAPAPSAPPSPPAPRLAPARDGEARETRERMTTRRKRIAENLLHAQHATAHLTTFNEVDMSAVEALRARLKERVLKDHGVKLSFMPFFVKAACQALKQFPVVNAQVDGEHIIFKHYVNMGIAVASEAGLVVPVIRDADRKGLLDIARDIESLARRGREGKLAIEDLMGGTFTITNGGVFGSLVSTPIINFPQVGILGLHKIQERPVVVNGEIVVRPMMYVALSYDHRIIDGQQAVLFVVRIKELMEDPASMLIE